MLLKAEARLDGIPDSVAAHNDGRLLREDLIRPLDQANEYGWVGEASVLADQIGIQDPTGP